MSDKFYIITKGQVDVLRTDKRTGQEIQVARLSEGLYFGEIGLLGRTERTATIKAVTDVECLTLNRDVFKAMLASSSAAYKDVDVVLRRRLAELGAMQGLQVADSAKADSDTVLKTRMIRDRLKVLDGDDISRMMGRTAYSISDMPTRHLEVQQAAGNVAVAERPAPIPAVVNPSPANCGFQRGVLMVRSGPSAGLRYEIPTHYRWPPQHGFQC
jgi:CRP-like cAMP-binding protein